MKKIAKLFILSIASMALLSACGKDTPKEDVYYTITFKQTGAADVIKTVKEGETLTDIPTPKDKVGYTVSWDVSDFSNIKENMTVNALSSANTYVATYSAPGFLIDGSTVSLTYDSLCSDLYMSLIKDNAQFLGWKYNDKVYTTTTVWDVAQNVTLEAEWKLIDNKVTITFIDLDGTTTIKTIDNGQTLTDIPTPKDKVGYEVNWDREDFSNITENIEVHAVGTAKSYFVNLNPNGGTIEENSLVVTYDESYSLEQAFNEDYFFDSWTYNDVDIPISGIWNIDEEDGVIELVAKWGESKWTEIL